MALPPFILPGDEDEFRRWCRSVNPDLVQTESHIDTAVSIHHQVLVAGSYVPGSENSGLHNWQSRTWLGFQFSSEQLAPYNLTQPIRDPELRIQLFRFYRRFDRMYPRVIDIGDLDIQYPDPTPYLPR